MATNYPSSLDNFTNPTSASPINSPSHADQHSNANDAIEALEAKVGSNNSAVTTSHDYKIAQLESLVTSAVAGAKSIYQDVRNQSGSTFTKATPIYVSGSEGASGKMLISAASNASESTSSKTMGLTSSSIANNNNGQIISEGILEGIDTTGAVDGDPVWLGVNGAKIYGLANKPSAPAHLVFLGIVIRGGQANTGSMYVKIQNGFELEELHNVEISSLLNGNILAYDSSTSTWKNTNTLQSTSSTVPLVIKGSTSQTANLQEWQDTTGTVKALVGSGGNAVFNGIRSGSGSTTAAINAYTTAAQIGILVRGAVSQTADLQQWQNSSGTAISGILQDGTVSIQRTARYSFNNGATGNERANISSNSNNELVFNITDGLTEVAHFYAGVSPTNAIQFNNVTGYPTANVFVIKGAASQSGDYFQIQNSGGTVLAQLNASNQFNVNYGSVYSQGGFRGGVNNHIGFAGLSGFAYSPAYLAIGARGAVNQIANLQEWQNSSATVIAAITPTGQGVFTNTTPIASSAVSQSITAVTYTSTTATYTYSATAQTILLGEYVKIAGVVPSGYNGTYQVTAVATVSAGTSYSFTISNSTNATVTTGTGTVFPSASVSIATQNKAHTGLIIKAVSGQTASTMEIQDSAGNPTTWWDSSGGMTASQAVVSTLYSGGFMNTGTRGYFNATTFTPSVSPIVVRGAASQTADLQQWQNSSGTVLSNIRPDGTIAAPYFDNPAASGSYLQANAATSIDIIARVVGQATLRVIGTASQTADLQRWQNSAGTALVSINSSGDLNFGSNLWNLKANGTNIMQWQPGQGSMFLSYGSSNTPISIQGSSGQTGDLTIWKNSSNVVLTKIDSSGALYLINPNPSANAGAITSPSINFQGSIWNNAYGSQTIKGAINVTEYLGNTNPTISKMSFLLATDNGTPAEVASFTNTGAFSNIGGLDAYGSSVIFRLRNTTDATTLAHTPSPKLELMGRAWNSSQGSAPTRAYLQVNANNINSDPFINRLGFFVATGNNAGGWIYGADATEYMSILGNGTVGINSTTPLATLDVRPTSASNKGLLIRATSAYAANLIDFQNSAGTTIARVAEGGQAMFPYYWDIFTQGESQGARIALRAPSASNPVAIFKAAASQTANLTEWQNSSNAVKTFIKNVGGDNNDLFGWVNSDLISGTYFSPTGSTNSIITLTSDGALVNPTSAAKVALTVQGLASQSSDVVQIKSSTGSIVTRFDAYGSAVLNGNIVVYGNSYLSGISAIFGATVLPISGNTNITALDTANTVLIVKGAVSQTANLQEWQTSSGTAVASITLGGVVSGKGLSISTSTNTTNAGTFYNAAGTIVFNVNTSLNQVDIGGGLSGIANNFGSSWGYDSSTNAGFITFQTGALGGDSLAIRRTNHVASGDYTISTLGNMRLSTASGKNFNFNNGNIGVATTAIGTNNKIIVNPYSTVDNLATVQINTNAATNKGLVVQGFASQTANLQEWQDSAGNILSAITNAGSLSLAAGKQVVFGNYVGTKINLGYGGNYQIGVDDWTIALQAENSTNVGRVAIRPAGATYGASYVNPIELYANGAIKQNLTVASNVGLIIKAATSQTANLQQWQNSSGTAMVSINADGSSNFNNIMHIKETWGGVALSVSALLGQSNPIQGWYTIDSNGDNKTEVAKIDINGQLAVKSVIGNTSSTISANTATTVDTVALSSFTTIEYTISIKQGSKVRSSKVLVHTDGTSIDSTEYGIMEMGGGITGILVTASVSSTNSILQVTITDASTTNATVKLIKTML